MIHDFYTNVFQTKRVLLILILLIASVLRFYGINFEIPHPDEHVTIQGTMYFMTDAPLNEYGLYTLYAWPAFTLVYIQFFAFSVYFIIGWLMNLFPGIAAFRDFYITDPSSFFLLGRIINVAFSIGTILVLYHIAKRQYNHRIALLASFFLSANFMYSFHSQFTRPDIPSLFFILMTLWFCLKIMEQRELKFYIYAGVFAGLAIATKFTSGIVLLLIFICHLISEESVYEKNKHDGNRPIFLLLIIFGTILFIAGISVSIFDFTGWIETYLLPDIRTNKQTQAFLEALIKLGYILGFILIISGALLKYSDKFRKIFLNGLLNKKLIYGLAALVVCFIIADPLFLINFKEQMKVFIYTPMFFGENDTFPLAGSLGFIGNILWYIKGPLVWGAGFVLLLLATMGILYSLLKKPRNDVVLLIFPFIYFIAICKGNLKWERYVIPLLPFIAVYAAVFLHAVVMRIKISRFPDRWKDTILAILAICIVALPVYNTLRYDFLLTQKDTRITSKEWIETNIPSGSKIGQDSYTGDLSEENYDITKKFSLGIEPFEYYLENGYQYLIVSDTQYERYFASPGRFEKYISFYNTLFSRGRLIKEIKPRNDLWPLPGERFKKYHIHISPRIKIFDISGN